MKIDREVPISEQRTLKMLYDSREHVDQMQREATLHAKTGQIEQEAAFELVGNAVSLWLDHVVPIVRSSFDLHGAKELWAETVFGEVIIDPVEHCEKITPHNEVDPEALEDDISARKIQFKGLESIANGQPASEQTVSAQWHGVEVMHPDNPQYRYREVSVTATRTIPLRIWESVITEVDTWLQDVGLGVEPGTPKEKQVKSA